jgi:hypothetical protein
MVSISTTSQCSRSESRTPPQAVFWLAKTRILERGSTKSTHPPETAYPVILDCEIFSSQTKLIFRQYFTIK